MLAHPEAIENPFFLPGPRMGAAAAGGSRHRRHRDRQPGGHHRRLFAGAAGDPTRPAAAARHRPHLGGIFRPDLSAARQHGAAGRRAAAGRACSDTSSALASAYGIAVAATMVVDGVLGHSSSSGKCGNGRLEGRAADGAARASSTRRSSRANLLKLLEGAGCRSCSASVMVMLILTWRRGTRILSKKTRKTEVPLEALLHSLEKKPPHTRAGHRGVPHQRSRVRADRAAAQPQAQQGAARAERHPHHRSPRTCRASTRGRAGDRSSRSAQTLLAGARSGSASWRRRTCRRRWPSPASRAGSSTSCRRRSSCRAGRSSPRRIPACRAGRTGCSSGLPRSANDATDYFQIPTGRVVEVGTQVTI